MRRQLVAVAAAAAVTAGALAGCSGSVATPYYDTICVDPLTQIRQPDVLCQGVHSSWLYYVPVGYSAPAYGVHVSGYSTSYYSRPPGAYIHTGGVPTAGGTATKYNSGNAKSSGKPTSKATTAKPKSGSTSKPKISTTKPKSGGFGGGSKPKSGGGSTRRK